MFYRERTLPVRILSLLLAGSCPAIEAAEDIHSEDRLEEIIVTAPFQRSGAETALPVGVLSGEELQEKVANTLGDTLKNEIGIANGSFGPGVGQPVIRGQTGNRVDVLQNGVGVTDVSSLSPDHANGVEASLAERLEVVRGPATLLYGSGAVGGVVNVIDNRIPSTLVDETEFFIEQNHNTVSDENKTVARLHTAVGAFGFHLDGFTRDSNNVEIKGLAIDEAALAEIDALVAATNGGAGAAEPEEIENTDGFLPNSDTEGQGGAAGFSYVGARGYIGFSVSHIDNEYGIPPGPPESEGDGEAAAEEEDAQFIRIDMDQTRYEVKGELSFDNGWIETLQGSIGLTDYEHKEVETLAGGEQEIGTLFSNEGVEGRVTATRAGTETRSGVWGLQFADTEFSALGEEAFIPRSDITSVGLFGVERYNTGPWTAEIGVRVEQTEIDPTGICNSDKTTFSVSGSVIHQLNSESNVLLGLSRSQRSPMVEELYSNIAADTCSQVVDDDSLVLHEATGLLEIGNPELDKETANNVELGFRKHSGAVTGEINAYFNSIDDYIFLDITGEEAAGQPIARYVARDANFTGLEGKVAFDLFSTTNVTLSLELFGDVVKAEFDAGGDLPRIPPAKFGGELSYFGSDWSVHVHTTRVMDQNDVSELELKTDGYTLLSIYGDYHIELPGRSEIKLFLRGDNLLDEEIRNHVSFLKNIAPGPGRGVIVGIRFEY